MTSVDGDISFFETSFLNNNDNNESEGTAFLLPQYTG